MKNKKLIIISSSIIAILAVIYLLLVLFKGTNDPEKTVNEIKDEEVFFTIQNALNDEITDYNYMSSQYIIEKIYHKEKDLINVYFIEAFNIKNDGFNDFYTGNLKYIMITKGMNYSVQELDSNINLEEYANDYIVEDLKDTSKLLPTYKFDEKNKLVFYISLFNNLKSSNYLKAYEYLEDKNKYTNVDDFANSDIYLSTDFNTYNKQTKDGKTVYTILTKSKEYIFITENSIMDFKIKF